MIIRPKQKYQNITILGKYRDCGFGKRNVLIQFKDRLNESLILGYDKNGKYLRNIGSISEEIANYCYKKVYGN